MKKTQKWIVPVAIAGFVTALLSWDQHDDPRHAALAFSSTATQNDDEANLIALDDNWFRSSYGSNEQAPPAEDVLIQKIPGDNNHLLMMAFYSRENYSGQFISIENGGHLVFRDDGKGHDKKAGDGLYTAKVAADVNEFRQKALGMTTQMRKKSYKPVRFDHRAMIVDPNADESFDMEKWERGETISISGLTNALSDLDLFDNTVEPGSAPGTVSRPNRPNNSVASSVSVDAVSVKLNSIRNNCVTITNLAVVEDPTRTWNSCTQAGNVDGPWTFKTIMKQLASTDPSNMATDVQVSDFVKNWLNNFATDQIINGDTVAARAAVTNKILSPWLGKSENAGAPAGQLDMRFAPFKLLSIVNRFDLRDGGVHGIRGSAVGEGRYVFCLINSACTDALNMTVILEYGVNKLNTCDARKGWAQQWVNLRNLTVGSSEYNQALQNITDQYTLCGSNPARPNQSSLDQLRTNEISLSSAIPGQWEMREFVLDPNGSRFLKQNTVAQNAADRYNAKVVNADVKRMVAYVNQNAGAIKADTFTVPLTWQGFPFLGGATKLTAFATGQPPAAYHWNGTDASNRSTFIKNDIARFNFSLNTCWGCHGGETQTGFTHIDPVFYGTQANLSGFLTGRAGANGAIDFDNNPGNDSLTVEDAALRPSTNPRMRIFNDILRRARDLNAVTTSTCGTVLSISSDLLFKPLNAVD